MNAEQPEPGLTNQGAGIKPQGSVNRIEVTGSLTPDPCPPGPEEEFTSLLAACDDALASGSTPLFPSPAGTRLRLEPRLQRDLACVQLLRQYLRRPNAASANLPPGAASSDENTPLAANPLKKLGRFEIRKELGRGGFGVVFQAYDPRLGRDVALKLPRAEVLVTTELRERFYHEARTAAGLDHPHIVPVYEAGEAGPICFIVSAYCPGITLAAWLRQQTEPIPFQMAAALVATLADAVHHAHQRGVVHRDLKPGNILLVSGGVVSGGVVQDTVPPTGRDDSPLTTHHSPHFIPKITDFGLAKVSSPDARTDKTQTGAILGTPSYMAPEQAGGQSKDLGPVTDVYALGAILYELLTGRPPFRSDTVLETLQQVQREEPTRPSRLRQKVPCDLETICLKCLEKWPERRYRSAAALAEDLRRFLAGEPVAARPVGPLGRFGRWCRRKPIIATLSIAVAGLLLLVMVGSPVAILLLSQERNQAQRNQHRAEQAEQEAINQLWQAYLDRALAGSGSRNAGQRFEGLKVLAQAAQIRPSLKLRNAAIACMARADLKVLKQWQRSPGAENATVYDVRLQHYAYKANDGSISVRRVADQREIQTLEGPGRFTWVFRLEFSPDGRHFGAVYNFPNDQPAQCFVWDLVHGRLLWKAPAADSGASLAFSPDGRWLAIGSADYSIAVFESASGKELYRLKPGSRQHTIAFHPDGRRLAVSSLEDRLVEIRDVVTGKVEAKLVHPAGVYGSAWTRDGQLLATGCADKNAYVWDMATGQQLAVLRGHTGGVTSVTFNHAGDLLATYSWDDHTRLWDPVSGNLLVSALGGGRCFSADDQCLAFANGWQLGIWEVAGCREWRTLHHGRIGNRTPWGETAGPWGVDFSPDGLLLASAGGDGLRLWDPLFAREVAHLPVGRTGSVLFQPGGDCLVSLGKAGLCRWPIRTIPGAAGGVRLGPPQCMEPPSKTEMFHAAWSHDGRTLGYLIPQSQQIAVLPVQNPSQKALLPGSDRDICLDLSPDGRWLAVCTWKGRGPKVWDLTASGPARELPLSQRWQNSCWLAFSPDGRWLVTREDDRYRCWRVGSWELEREIVRPDVEPEPGPLAFSRDGLLAIMWPRHSVLLVNPATGEEIATLASPDPQQAYGLCFSPDGGQLAVATDNHTIQLWDLRLIRRQLAKMNLDWDWPPCPPPSKAAAPPGPVEVLLGEFARKPSAVPPAP